MSSTNIINYYYCKLFYSTYRSHQNNLNKETGFSKVLVTTKTLLNHQVLLLDTRNHCEANLNTKQVVSSWLKSTLFEEDLYILGARSWPSYLNLKLLLIWAGSGLVQHWLCELRYLGSHGINPYTHSSINRCMSLAVTGARPIAKTYLSSFTDPHRSYIGHIGPTGHTGSTGHIGPTDHIDHVEQCTTVCCWK